MRTTWQPLSNETKLTFLLALTFLFLFSSGVFGETKKFNIATGTGFFLGSSNYVVTNYHVIHGGKKIQVKLVNGEILVAEIALKNPEKDIAILRINGTPSVKRMNVKLSSFSEIRTGDKVFTYGFPMTDFLGDISSIYSEGVINSLKGIRNNPDEFQVSIPIQPGNSGGPIFNKQGTLVGVTTRTLSTVSATGILGVVPQNVNFGIKSSVLGKLLPEIPEILQFDMGIVPVPSQQFSLRDFKENIKKNIVFVSVSVEKEIGNLQVAFKAHKKGDYKTALEQFKILAKQGNSEAQFNLGEMYHVGQGVPQDYKEAVKWLKLSAEQGIARAQFNLGLMNEKGQGVPQDGKEAVKWWKLSAEQGEVKSQYSLGLIYNMGERVPQDYKEAFKWWKLAAEQGYADAQFNLGLIYNKGERVPQDYKEATKWYRLSAEQGDAKAQVKLGAMYAKGLGVPQDYVLAHMWFNLFGSSGDKKAEEYRNIVEKKMTPSQIEKAQEMARNWKPKK